MSKVFLLLLLKMTSYDTIWQENRTNYLNDIEYMRYVLSYSLRIIAILGHPDTHNYDFNKAFLFRKKIKKMYLILSTLYYSARYLTCIKEFLPYLFLTHSCHCKKSICLKCITLFQAFNSFKINSEVSLISITKKAVNLLILNFIFLRVHPPGRKAQCYRPVQA